MRKFLFLFFLIFFLTTGVSLSYSSDPRSFIKELVDEATTVLKDKSLTDEKKNKVIEIIAKNNVDIKALGYYTLGPIRKTLDDKALSTYDELFEKYFLKSLTSRLKDYSDQKFEVLSAEQKSANYTIVSSKINSNNNNPEIKIDWRVYTKNPEKPLIRDLIVEGLSLARTQKEEFSSILESSSNDINSLFSKLKEFVSN